MPWVAVAEAIDDDFNPVRPADSQLQEFESRTGHLWDNIGDHQTYLLVCPKCRTNIHCPWYTPPSSGNLSEEGVVDELQGSGYGEKDFKILCESCKLEIDHNLLQLQKFRRDVETLLTNDAPMPGTILSLDGIPKKVSEKPSSRLGTQLLFPNRLIKHGIKHQILEITDPRRSLSDNNGKGASMLDIRNLLQDSVKDRNILKTLVTGASGRLLKD